MPGFHEVHRRGSSFLGRPVGSLRVRWGRGEVSAAEWSGAWRFGLWLSGVLAAGWLVGSLPGDWRSDSWPLGEWVSAAVLWALFAQPLHWEIEVLGGGSWCRLTRRVLLFFPLERLEFGLASRRLELSPWEGGGRRVGESWLVEAWRWVPALLLAPLLLIPLGRGLGNAMGALRRQFRGRNRRGLRGARRALMLREADGLLAVPLLWVADDEDVAAFLAAVARRWPDRVAREDEPLRGRPDRPGPPGATSA